MNEIGFYFTLWKYTLNLASWPLGGVEKKAFNILQWIPICAYFVSAF